MVLKIGTPVKPMLVKESGGSDKKFEEIVKKHNGLTFAEIKSDGYRVQVHKDYDDVSLFTRNLNKLNSEVFPDLDKQFKELPAGIYDGELVGVEDGIKGFNAVKKRVRGELVSSLVDDYPLQIKFFDLLKLENREFINEPLIYRREILDDYVANLSVQNYISNGASLKTLFEDVTGQGLEGLVCKNPESQYLIGGRNSDWIKLKNFLTLDLVILGLYKGKSGRAAELPFAGVLLGTRNNGMYETITKVGLTGKDKVERIYEMIKNSCVSDIPENVIISDAINKKTYARKVPFCYVRPEKSIVLETQTLNITNSKNWHSCGLDNNYAHSLRIPIVKEIRYDKLPKDCTTTKQIKEIYDG